MITHDVDEAILLADRILLMTNGPYARVAESVVIDIPRPRNRAEIIHDKSYYAIRNHLVEFLALRSKTLAAARPSGGGGPSRPAVVRPSAPRIADAEDDDDERVRPAEREVISLVR
jgi:nitrate/nitrite transport system ATP-binding protein